MKISKILLFLGLLLFQLHFAQEKADVVLNKALTEAKSKNKNVLLMFHASWCKWCHVMEKNMNLPETKPIFDKKFVTAYVDVQEMGEKKKLENPGGEALMEKYKGKDAGLPFWLVLNPKGEVLADSFNDKNENLGCPSTAEEVDVFVAKLKKSSKMNDKKLQTVKQTFLKKN
ncbi:MULTISPECIES: thioredoxin family protein [unclassified Chryseobacterium]|uniref:thioredoxin family protein n=1 Tax=unclassified Chryseobacterium TaxID=2593645 RepID=UPI000D3B8F5A|nr:MULTISPECIES: thioredoxin family protein [unclassified Chryseobacterium]PTT73033.1 thioredoxin family protein [Chryseobacterium sp. HMWF001]PVV55706.1 thioredoxin family protein [Chryseobacterium sp. HMWF035]